jgi:hypothetical protein
MTQGQYDAQMAEFEAMEQEEILKLKESIQ